MGVEGGGAVPGKVGAGRRPGKGEVLPGGSRHVVPHHWLGEGLGGVTV